MTQDEINEFQLYLQMYDKNLLSKKRVLAKLNINWEDEKKEIEKDIEFDTSRFYQPSIEVGGVGMGCSCDKEDEELRRTRTEAKFESISNSLDALLEETFKPIDLKIKKLDEKAIIPKYAHEGDAGFDLSAIVFEKTWDGYTDTITVLPGERYIAKTGLAFAVPNGYELQVRPRSGLAYKHGITVINSPGTVDSSYRGQVMIILLNTGLEPFEIKTGDRIAQGVINKLPTVSIREVDELDETERGVDGFGSTG